MPTYEYVCDSCETQFEVFQSMKDDPLTKCQTAKCKGKVRRVLSGGAGIIFKGSGFYTTDYRSDSYKNAAKADTSAATSASKSTGDSGGSGSSGASAAAPSTPAPAAPAAKETKAAKST